MSEREAFVRAIAADLYDDTPRLAFADWLDDHGEHDRAEFIRVQVELEPIRDKYEIPRAAELHERENKLLREQNWLGDMPAGWDDYKVGMEIEFRRGFPDLLRCSVKAFTEFGHTIRERHPTIRRVVIHCLNGWGERLAACSALERLTELELACWYADADMEALSASPHLSRLQVLVLWMGRLVDGTDDATLCRLAAKAKAWPNLRELVLLDPEGDNAKGIQRLVASANDYANRKIAKYERGYPELFPLAADFDYGCPGRLPDGRLAFARAERESQPFEAPAAWWVVQTFDPNGTPRKKVLRVPLPPELLPEDWSESQKFEGQRMAILRERLGFEPAFIRIKDIPDSDLSPQRGHYERWGTRGYTDDPKHPTRYSGTSPNGFGGDIYNLMRNGEFVIAYEARADKRGRVHST
ncbi:MAG TPA: TIGR02996 domain-containing protein [Gemmata sp.]